MDGKMKKPNALEHFRGSTPYNCAQAVLKAYAPWVGLEDACVKRFAAFGGGQAPEGECGALFAAKAVFQDSVVRKEIEDEFIRAAGNRRCRDIRKGKSFTCRQCVETAADAVFLRIGDGHVLQRPTECSQ